MHFNKIYSFYLFVKFEFCLSHYAGASNTEMHHIPGKVPGAVPGEQKQ